MNPTLAPPSEELDRGQVAAYLSLLPGLGHLYKHHYLAGCGILVGGNLLVAFVTVLLGLATFGLAFLVVPLLWVTLIATSAYHLDDWHGRHDQLHSWRHREG